MVIDVVSTGFVDPKRCLGSRKITAVTLNEIRGPGSHIFLPFRDPLENLFVWPASTIPWFQHGAWTFSWNLRYEQKLAKVKEFLSVIFIHRPVTFLDFPLTFLFPGLFKLFVGSILFRHVMSGLERRGSGIPPMTREKTSACPTGE